MASALEPLDPFFFAEDCYVYYSGFYPRMCGGMPFPIPRRKPWSSERYEAARNAAYSSRIWFAVDADQAVAVFHTDRFGAIPLSTAAEDTESFWPDLVHCWIAKDLSFEEFMDNERYDPPAYCGPHWLEHPFRIASPNWLGLYHYDASWHHPLPYARVRTQNAPIRFDDIPSGVRKMMAPTAFPGIRFAEAKRIQPFEHMPCRAVSDSSDDKDFGRAIAEVWISADLKRVELCGPFSVKPDADDRLLDRARRHMDYIEALPLLAASPPPDQ